MRETTEAREELARADFSRNACDPELSQSGDQFLILLPPIARTNEGHLERVCPQRHEEVIIAAPYRKTRSPAGRKLLPVGRLSWEDSIPSG